MRNVLPQDFYDGCLMGRRKIFTNQTVVTRENVKSVVSKALSIHNANATEITTLYARYRGYQPILKKQKLVREEINNKIVVNLANQNVTFKSAYFWSAPIQYASYGDDDKAAEIRKLSKFMRAADKETKDKELSDWFFICGVAVRLILPSQDPDKPFDIFTPDPRDAFVIYTSHIGEAPVAGVIIQTDENDNNYYCVYTDSRYFEIRGDEVTEQVNWLGAIPVIEYLNNNPRIGAFEPVVSIENAINQLASDRVDNIQDFVNAYDVFENCEISEENYKSLAVGGGAVMIKSADSGLQAKVYRISSEINQSGVQSVIDDLTEDYLTISGMPNRNGGSSTSDTGAGVIYRDGWAEAESRASDTDKMFYRSERPFLNVVLKICIDKNLISKSLTVADIKIEHPRTNLANAQSRMQILCEGLNNPKIHPRFVWLMAGVPNAEEWYTASENYYQDYVAKMEQSLTNEGEDELRQGGRIGAAAGEAGSPEI